MPTKSLKIDSIELDLENPRITIASDQRDAMQKILNEQKVRLVNLAESIAAKGFNPMDRFLVLRSPRAGKFIALEGNRRILAAKLLKNTALINTLQMPDPLRKRLLKASTKFDSKKVEPLDCYEVSDRAEGIDWIWQRHIGEDGGRGIVRWGAMAGSRFSGRYPALQAVDFVLEHGDLTDDQKEMIVARFPITTLDRLIATPSVRQAIGIEVVSGKLQTDLPATEIMKPLKRIVLDLAGFGSEKITVTQLKSRTQQESYIKELKPADRASHATRAAAPVSLESMKEKDFVAKSTPAASKTRSSRVSQRTAVVPKTCKLTIPTAKIAGIYGELRTLQLSKHVHAIGVLMRVFLEMSVDDYLEKKAGSKLTFIDPNSGRTIDRKLKDKVNETITHMVTNGTVEKDLKGVKIAMNDALNPFSIDTLHAYIHNRFFTPTDTHLVTGWDNAQRFFENIWP